MLRAAHIFRKTANRLCLKALEQDGLAVELKESRMAKGKKVEKTSAIWFCSVSVLIRNPAALTLGRDL